MMDEKRKLSIKLSSDRKPVYEVLLDPEKVASWRVPEEMTCSVYEFQPWVGGKIRISLTYLDETQRGKTKEHTDTYHGTFLELVPYERIVEEDQFESEDETLRSSMTITYLLEEVEEGCLLAVQHEGLPESVSEDDNITGWKESMTRLKELLLEI